MSKLNKWIDDVSESPLKAIVWLVVIAALCFVGYKVYSKIYDAISKASKTSDYDSQKDNQENDQEGGGRRTGAQKARDTQEKDRSYGGTS